MIAVSASISIGDAASEKLVPLARLLDTGDPCDPGPDLQYPTARHMLPRPVSSLYRCFAMRLGDRDATLIDAVVDHEHQLAVYDADGTEIVPLTQFPFDPYPYGDQFGYGPYELLDLDRDGSDEIVMHDDHGSWIRVLAVRGHTLMTTPEHVFISGDAAHPRSIYARDPLVPLASVVPAPLASYTCGALTFVLSKPNPVSQVVTVYRTGTSEVLVGPREPAWAFGDRFLRSPCSARVTTDGEGLSYAIEDR